jgi:uncharacterized protein GlcG (DUF336 family)
MNLRITIPRIALSLATTAVLASGLLLADDDDEDNRRCQGLPSAASLRAKLNAAPGMALNADGIGGTVGGLFGGTRMWGAVVNRSGQICSFATSTADPTQVWPGSQAIAKAKAYTANAFSLDTTSIAGIAGFPLSTAELYTFTQPGHSLWSLGQSNPFNPLALAPPSGGGTGLIAGGLIFFGGGVALYNGSGRVIGGLGVSGDTSCADHEIAKRVRDLLGLNPPGGPTADDISYSSGPGGAPSQFTHPLCIHTWKNGVQIGEEPNATGY